MTTATSFRECEQIIINELSDVLSNVDENQIDELVDLITGARKVFFVGVGRVELALEAIAKRLAHLSIDTVMVGADYRAGHLRQGSANRWLRFRQNRFSAVHCWQGEVVRRESGTNRHC